MDPYVFVRGLHIFSAFILFGTGLGTAFHMYVACRSGAIAGIARVARQVVLADWLFTLPAGFVQLATGLWLVHLAGHDLTAPWLLLSYLLYATAGAAWLVVVKLQLDLQRLAVTAMDRGSDLPDRFWQAFRLWVRLGWVGFVSLIGIFVLMIARPALW